MPHQLLPAVYYHEMLCADGTYRPVWVIVNQMRADGAPNNCINAWLFGLERHLEVSK